MYFCFWFWVPRMPPFHVGIFIRLAHILTRRWVSHSLPRFLAKSASDPAESKTSLNGDLTHGFVGVLAAGLAGGFRSVSKSRSVCCSCGESPCMN